MSLLISQGIIYRNFHSHNKGKPSNFCLLSKNFVSFCSTGNTHADVQKCLMKRLTKLRRNDQQKRKAMYDADNGIVFDGSESMEIVCDILVS